MSLFFYIYPMELFSFSFNNMLPQRLLNGIVILPSHFRLEEKTNCFCSTLKFWIHGHGHFSCFLLYIFKCCTTPQTSQLSTSESSLAKLQVGHAKSHLWSVQECQFSRHLKLGDLLTSCNV